MSHKLKIKKYSAIFILFLYLLQSPLPVWNAGAFVLCYAADNHIEIEYLLNNKCVKSAAPISNAGCCTSLDLNLPSIDFDQSSCIDIRISVSAEKHTGRNSTCEIRIPTASNVSSSLMPDENSLYKASRSAVTAFPQNQTLTSISSTILLI
jgi:hypothetical protein